MAQNIDNDETQNCQEMNEKDSDVSENITSHIELNKQLNGGAVGVRECMSILGHIILIVILFTFIFPIFPIMIQLVCWYHNKHICL